MKLTVTCYYRGGKKDVEVETDIPDEITEYEIVDAAHEALLRTGAGHTSDSLRFEWDEKQLNQTTICPKAGGQSN